MKLENTRYNEVDFMKGLAVISMVIFHYFYLGTQMGVLNYNTSEGILHFLARFAHITFIFMVGVNMVVSKLNSENQKDYKKKQCKRIVLLLFLALVISVATYNLFPDRWVRFGILHFIAFGTILLLPVIDKPVLGLGIAILVYLINLLNQMGLLSWIHDFIHEIPAFILGLFNTRFAAMDHFAILKFLPVIALGIFVGHQIYKSGERKIKELNIFDKILHKDNIIVQIGKYSLQIYIAHWIILYIYFSNI